MERTINTITTLGYGGRSTCRNNGLCNVDQGAPCNIITGSDADMEVDYAGPWNEEELAYPYVDESYRWYVNPTNAVIRRGPRGIFGDSSGEREGIEAKQLHLPRYPVGISHNLPSWPDQQLRRTMDSHGQLCEW